MESGEFKVWTNNFGSVLIDAGAMFGSVPKAIWGKLVATDQLNRARLVTRSLLIKNGKRTFLIDAGCGPNLPQKYVDNFAIANTTAEEWRFNPAEITDIIITHLHFDHCGWLARPRSREDEALEPMFPAARVYIQKSNYENAKQPSLKERASYLQEQIEMLKRCQLELIDGDCELVPGLSLHHSHGHTRGLQWVKLQTEAGTVVFPGDLIPSSHHLPVPYTTGYDIWADRLLEEKDAILSSALLEKWLIVFQHDPQIEAATVGRNKKGHYAVEKALTL